MNSYRIIKISLIFFLFLAGCGSNDLIVVPSDIPIGEPYKISISGSHAKLRLMTPNSTEEFFFIINTSSHGKENHQTLIRANLLQSSMIPVMLTKEESLIEEKSFDTFLRDSEREQTENFKLSFAETKKALKPTISTPIPARTFQVLNNYINSKSYSTVNATLESLSTESAFYIDENLPSQIKSDPTFLPAVKRLQKSFDEIIKPLDRFYFGKESDVDGMNQIIVLMSPVVNSIDTGGLGGVLGFFYSEDLLINSGRPTSNKAEIIYLAIPSDKIAPIKTGSPSDTINYCFDKVFTGTLAHEFQHMINFNQHVLKNGGTADTESLWLNEGLSHLAEDLTGFGLGNIPRVNLYLSSTGTYPLATNKDSNGTRGASYLFLRYLHDRFDSQDNPVYLRKLTANRASGTKNIEAAFGKSFEDLYEDWLATLALSDSGISNNSDYSYSAVINDSYLLARPKIEELRATQLLLNPTSAMFYTVKANGRPTVEINVSLENNSGSGIILIPIKK